MTVLKFRTWSLPDKTMWDVVAINFDDKQVTMFNEERYNDVFTMGFQNAVLMQSTGLFDKNGREIFESDIVQTTRFEGRADENGCFYEYEKDYRGVVKMLEGCWLIDTGKEVVDLWSEIDENVVIGNIYENKELLEVTDG